MIADDDNAPEEAREIAKMREQRETIYRELLAVIAARYEYGELSKLTPEQMEGLHVDANEFLDRWAQDAEMEPARIEFKDDLGKLLKQHFELGQQILDVEDDEMQRLFGDVIDDADD